MCVSAGWQIDEEEDDGSMFSDSDYLDDSDSDVENDTDTQIILELMAAQSNAPSANRLGTIKSLVAEEGTSLLPPTLLPPTLSETALAEPRPVHKKLP